MKSRYYKILLIGPILFFLVMNTTYFWEGWIGMYELFLFPFLTLIFFILFLALLRHLTCAMREKFSSKKRNIVVLLLIFVLTSVFLKPTGIIDFEMFEAEIVLQAEREGAANCYTVLKLKSDNTFKEKTICFGMSENTGKYHIQNDTIFFENISLSRGNDSFYTHAIIRTSIRTNKQIKRELIRFEDDSDTTGHFLFITKNELKSH